MLINASNLDLVYRGFRTVYNESFEAAPSYYDRVAMTVSSSTRSEDYGWLGQYPKMREWIGDRVLKGLTTHGFTIKNRDFESTIEVDRNDIADDRVGIFKPLFAEMGRTARLHPDELVFSLLKSGFGTRCFDGQYFFDADHPGIDAETGEEISISNMQAGAGEAWYLLDTSRAIKPIIWQEREKYDFQSITDPKDYNVFMKRKFIYGVNARVNCGFGLWHLAFGSKATLDAVNYAAARQAMSKFTGDQGNLLGIRPTLLVVPPALEQQARQLLMAEEIAGTSNIWKGSIDFAVVPMLG